MYNYFRAYLRQGFLMNKNYNIFENGLVWLKADFHLHTCQQGG